MSSDGAMEPSEEQGKPATSGTRQFLRILGYMFVVPVLMIALLVWTLLWRLSSLGPRTALVSVVALAVTPIVVDARFQWGTYEFDSSLLDSVCMLVGICGLCVCALRSHEASVVLAGKRRRLAVLPLTLAAAAYFIVKITVVSSAGAARWKVVWLCLSILLSSFVYVSLSRWWTDTSFSQLAIAEAALLEAYGKVEFEQSVVAGLGTVFVKDRSDQEGARDGHHKRSGKPILVLLHGFAAGNGFWMFVLKDLSAHFRVICVEMYGCGRSLRLPVVTKTAADTERLLVDSLERWREAMGIEKMVLCGHSLGGMMAAAYAMEHPQRLQQLALLSPAGVGGLPEGPEGDDSFTYRVYEFLWMKRVSPLSLLRWSGPLGLRLTRLMIEKRLSWVPESAKIRDVDSRLLGGYVFQLLALPPSGEKLLYLLLSPMLHGYRPLLETFRAASDGDTRGISCPVSIIYGAPGIDWMSHSDGVALAERLVREGIRASVYTVPDAGHTLIIDNPDDFTRIFLNAFYGAGTVSQSPAV